MKSLERLLKLAETFYNNSDFDELNRINVQFASYLEKHAHYTPVTPSTTPNPWKRNMDYSKEENSPYYGSVSEFMDKFPGGLKDWIAWRRKNKGWTKYDNKKTAAEEGALGDIEFGVNEEDVAEKKEKAFSLLVDCLDVLKEEFGVTNEEIKALIEKNYGKMSEAHMEPDTLEFVKLTGPKPWIESVKSYINKKQKDSSQKAEDAAYDAVKDFISYWKLLLKGKKRRSKKRKSKK